MQKNFQKANDTANSTQIREKELLLALAARAYELDKRHLPSSAADLAPDYLKAVPQDPFTGKNMVFPAK